MSVEENKKIAREFTERLGKGDNSVVDELLTEDYVGHAFIKGYENIDRQLLKQTNDMGHKGFPDYSMTVDDMIAEGDKVFVLSTRRGTNTGVFSGNPPTGKYVEIPRFALYRFEGEKIAEGWVLDNYLSQWRQLGFTLTPLTQETNK